MWNRDRADSRADGAAQSRSRRWPADGALENRDLVAAEIRRFKPKVILSPYPGDRHPDHDAAGKLVQAASSTRA